MPGCYRLPANEIFGLPAWPATASALYFDAVIPLNMALLTQHFCIQDYAFALRANAAQIVTSNGIT